MIKQLRLILLLISLVIGSIAKGQYTMGNFTVYDCQGTLTDSEVGNDDYPTGYDHNENYTFTICVPEASQVEISFSFFQLETTSSGGVSLDILTIHQGADRNGPVIGQYTGDQNPGTIVVQGECVTIHFVSDASVNAEGWVMDWIFDPPDPVPPVLNPIPNPTCSTQVVILDFEDGIACSQVNANNFSLLSGPTGAVANARPLNCVNDTTRQVEITFDQPLDRSGVYTVGYNIVYFDICNNPFQFNGSISFSIIDCPLEVEIIGDTLVCTGNCTDLFADVQGGDFNNYSYTWTPAAPNQAVNRYCPAGPPADSVFTVVVSVTDGNAQPASDTITVIRLPLPTVPPDFSICRFGGDTNLTATPAGGGWFGPGMNGQGRFRPQSAGAGTHTVGYVAPNGCVSTLDITVHPVNSPFQVSMCSGASVQINGTPAGGTWSGSPNIDAAGMYTTAGVGRDTVMYTEPNFGCEKLTYIEVVDSVEVPTIDSIIKCTNEGAFNLPFSPIGGTWNGPAINNNGRFNPGNAGPGRHVLTYSIPGGCTDSTTVEVFDIAAGNDTILCPSEPAFVLNTGNPAGGIWSGPGVVANADSSVYTFDTPSFNNTDTSVVLQYTLSSCSATKTVNLIQTRVDDFSTQLCEYDSIGVIPTGTLNATPGGGNWFGNNFNNDTLDIRNYGPGTYYVYYEYNNNGCLDSVAVSLNAKPTASTPAVSDTVCPRELDFDLIGAPAGGTWSGIGIVDANQGTFSPTSIGFSGTFESFYEVNGCFDTTEVFVRVPNLSILGFGDTTTVCFQYGNPIDIMGTPQPGYFAGPGIIDPNIARFDPSAPDAGTGTHTIEYIFGSGACEYRDTAIIVVQDTLEIDSIVGPDAICFGETAVLTAYITGGRGQQSTYSLTWAPTELIGGTSPFEVTVGPTETQEFTLMVQDRATSYCGYSTNETYNLVVHPEITYDAIPGPTVCYGQVNYTDVFSTSPNPLEFTWINSDGDSVVGDHFEDIAGRYDLIIEDLTTGCIIESREELPQYEYLEVGIVTVPNKPCVSILDPNIFVINSTVGAEGGSWLIEDADTTIVLGFDPGGNFEFAFPDTGNYTINLSVFNGGGQCGDSVKLSMCVDKIVTVFIPTAFSPNGDGDNDVWPNGARNDFGNFTPQGYDLLDFEVSIHDRWGQRVFSTETNPDVPWNGNHFNRNGEKCRPGIYSYHATLYFDEFNHQDINGTIMLLR